ncbi:MAG: hypothetical protein IPM66_24170 [Acidobacteriota bacterium]|nr:MAG: hypothetical protein IPM66_24170 [Acidobacteriota bacterium]
MTQQICRRLIALSFLMTVMLIGGAAAQPTANYPNDMKPGSVLFFNRYTSNPSNPQMGDTLISITNLSQSSSGYMHLFLVDGSTCSVADFTLALTANQTVSFLMSDFDPGIQGYIVGVATDGSTPTQFNWFAGHAYIRETDGRMGNLPAIGLSKNSPGEISPKEDGSFAITFNGAEYDRLPTSVALTSFNSQTSDNTNLIIYSPSSNLMIGSADLVSIFTLIYDDTEKSISSSFTSRCYRYDSLVNLFNRGGGINRHVPFGRTGWIRMTASGRPLLGSVINKGPVFQGAFNLHTISLLTSYEITLPVF